jgi:hypothetical protein
MSLFGNIGRSIVDARMRQARGQLYSTLLGRDEELARNIGIYPKELRNGAAHRFLV